MEYGNLTHATLAKQSKQLEGFGLIVRKEYPQVPPKVEYSLSDLGRKLIPSLESDKVAFTYAVMAKYTTNAKLAKRK
ncbi:putative HTH-type transcriptional regulator YtcD [compost metagenome]